MGYLIIDEYWNKVIDDPNSALGRKVLKDEYYHRSRTNMGIDTRTNKELKQHLKRFTDYVGEVEPGVFKQRPFPAYYGINSYQLVYISDDNLESFYPN